MSLCESEWWKIPSCRVIVDQHCPSVRMRGWIILRMDGKLALGNEPITSRIICIAKLLREGFSRSSADLLDYCDPLVNHGVFHDL